MSVAVTRLRTQDKARLEDFLNDKLQTPADLGNLDNLLESVKQQQQLLKQQVSCFVEIWKLTLTISEAPRSH